jgi:ABC-2 type transport system permease protein
MYKLWRATYKEFLLLIRDIGALAILFIMPLVLLITVTLIQERPLKRITNTEIPIIVVDNDKDELSASIFKHLKTNKSFEVITETDGKKIDEKEASQLVLKGDYQLAIVIPKGLTTNLKTKVNQNVSKVLKEFGVEEDSPVEYKEIQAQQINLYFDPATILSFKTGVKNAIDKIVSEIETESIYKAFQEELGSEDNLFNNEALISFVEVNPHDTDKSIKPNSVQHNVPAWALFAIFFIVIPFSINMVKEKGQGTFVRLKTNPISYATIIGGKVTVYMGVCMIQFILMLLVGYFIFPHIGLPALVVNGSYFLLFLVAFFSALAAIGFGVLLGTLADTPEQSAPFGATAVIVLAALGGIWVPVFVMPKFMQVIAKISPMNWGLDGFYDVILRDASFLDIFPEIALLGSFFIVMAGISVYYDKVKSV